MSLASYERLKLDLAALLRSETLASGPRAKLRDELMAKLAQDRFNLVTVGRFSRGKSSLMNALLDTTRLPMGIVPLTSVITIVQYGSVPRATLYYHGTSLFMDVSLDELPRHITERGNPGNRAGIVRAEIELPAQLLRYGFRFVDTPGLGSSIMPNTRTTLEFLGEADALLIVTSFDSPLSVEEANLLHTARQAGVPVFLAVNKADMVDATDRAAVLDHIADQLAEAGMDGVTPFPVSALRALERRESRKADSGEDGIAALRQALVSFLIAGRQQSFLSTTARRVQDLLAGGGDEDGLKRLTALTGQIAALKAEDAHESGLSETLRRSCPICEAVGRAAFDAVTHLQYRLGQEAALRENFANGPRLCPPHARQFGATAGPLSTARGLADAIETIARRLDDTGRDPVQGVCPVCAAIVTTQAQAIADQAAAEPHSAALICLPHLPAVLTALPPDRRVAAHRRITTQFSIVADDMRRFALRREGAGRHTIAAEEARAARDAIDILAGNPDAWPVGRDMTSPE